MREEFWTPEGGRTLVCVDSYQKGVPMGRFYSSLPGGECFHSMTHFLLKMEESLNDRQTAQPYTTPRTFSQMLADLEGETAEAVPRRGHHATFEIEVLFRQNTSWQGIVRWRERKTEQSFRSVLELIHLMDSALRSQEGACLSH